MKFFNQPHKQPEYFNLKSFSGGQIYKLSRKRKHPWVPALSRDITASPRQEAPSQLAPPLWAQTDCLGAQDRLPHTANKYTPSEEGLMKDAKCPEAACLYRATVRFYKLFAYMCRIMRGPNCASKTRGSHTLFVA